jgi:hypothetical protein
VPGSDLADFRFHLPSVAKLALNMPALHEAVYARYKAKRIEEDAMDGVKREADSQDEKELKWRKEMEERAAIEAKWSSSRRSKPARDYQKRQEAEKDEDCDAQWFSDHGKYFDWMGVCAQVHVSV